VLARALRWPAQPFRPVEDVLGPLEGAILWARPCLARRPRHLTF
jgi:hypothetical protein